MKLGNIFQTIPEDLTTEVFDLLIQNDNVKIEHIVSHGHSSPDYGCYDQDHHEWVIVLQGAAIISFEQGLEFSLQTGDHLNIPAHTKHRVKWTDPDTETIWIAVHY